TCFHPAHRIWILGESYNCDENGELHDDIYSRILLTYRKGFEPINGIAPTSDRGWGCMLRCGQMVVAQALMVKHLGREWRLKSDKDKKIYFKILKLFHDNTNSFYSVHRIAQMGACNGIPVGHRFTPNDIAQVLKDLVVDDRWNNLAIHVALDNIVYTNDIIESLFNEQLSEFKFDCKRSVLLFIPLRIGLNKADPIYFKALRKTFKMKESLGIIGGRPHRGLYFIGCAGNQLLYLDPHSTQRIADLSKFDDRSYHQEKIYHLKVDEIDPSIALCFLFNSETEFDDWCVLVRKILIQNQTLPLFELSSSHFDTNFIKSNIFDPAIKDYDYI
ncbi:cysteine peptidase 2 family C54 protein-like protein, partial [Dinothrombium tinctorium]